MIGKHFRVKLIPKYFNTEVRGCSTVLAEEYPKYSKLHNKEVIVLASKKNTKSSYKVYLADRGDKYWFSIDKKFLKPLNGPATCSCPTKTLMCRGCQCGAFNREKMKVDKEEQEQFINNPW